MEGCLPEQWCQFKVHYKVSKQINLKYILLKKREILKKSKVIKSDYVHLNLMFIFVIIRHGTLVCASFKLTYDFTFVK